MADDDQQVSSEAAAEEEIRRQQWVSQTQKEVQFERQERERKQRSSAEGDVARMAKLARGFRIFNISTAALGSLSFGVTLLLTILAMNGQLIFGNGFHSRFVPPLSSPEILLLAILDLLFVLILLSAVALLIIVVGCAEHPVDCTVSIIQSTIKSIFQ